MLTHLIALPVVLGHRTLTERSRNGRWALAASVSGGPRIRWPACAVDNVSINEAHPMSSEQTSTDAPDAGSAASRRYCSELARADGAVLIGSADPVDVWILLEYSAVWRARALNDNALSPAVNNWLRNAVAEIESTLACKARLLFVRQTEREYTPSQTADLSGRPHKLFVVRSGERDARVSAVDLPNYDALLQLDAVALARDGTGAEVFGEPLYLVCTNGQRDLCCARFGLPVYEQLARLYGDSVWQTTHVGGHRYAPNLICLPEGVVYGFADTAVAPALVQATRSAQLDLEYLRGRSCYSAVGQVAEHTLRRHFGERRLGALRLLGEQRLEPGRWRLSFEVAGQGRKQVHVRELAPLLVQASCGDDASKRLSQFAAELA